MEQIDTLLNGYKIIQDSERFMFGIDAVLLSHFAATQITQKDNVIDLGTGTGIIPLLLAGSSRANHISALEIQEESADMACRSVCLNELQNKIEVIQGDIKTVSDKFTRHSFSVVTCNPPYMICEHGRQNDLDAKSIARHEVLCTLEDVISAADFLLQPHGKFFMIHRPFRLPEIFNLLQKYKMEPKRMRFFPPAAGKEPNLVLIEARKNAKSRLKIEPELPVYGDISGEYSDGVKEIYNFFKKTED